MDATGPDGRPKRVKVTIWDTGMVLPLMRSCSELCCNFCWRAVSSNSRPGAVQNFD
jgi:hypothetical protein